MNLQGKKKDGTDLHSKVANLVGISRDQAKVRKDIRNNGYVMIDLIRYLIMVECMEQEKHLRKNYSCNLITNYQLSKRKRKQISCIRKQKAIGMKRIFSLHCNNEFF